MNAKRTPASKKTTPRPRSAAQRRRAILRNIGNFLTSRSRDIALVAIVLGAFVAVFDGSLYSATRFGFLGASAVAFAVMPDALMVLSAAKMRQVGITAAQHATAKRSMRIALVFSLVTNMIAAFMRHAPELVTPEFLLVGAVVYHGMVVIFLWCASETLLKTRADRKGAKVSEAAAAPAAVAAPAPAPWTPTHPAPRLSWANVRQALVPGTR